MAGPDSLQIQLDAAQPYIGPCTLENMNPSLLVRISSTVVVIRDIVRSSTCGSFDRGASGLGNVTTYTSASSLAFY